MQNMHYKTIENGHMENAIFGKDFNLSTIDFLFHVFIFKCENIWIIIGIGWLQYIYIYILYT
jgi:hypothetical protein